MTDKNASPVDLVEAAVAMSSRTTIAPEVCLELLTRATNVWADLEELRARELRHDGALKRAVVIGIVLGLELAFMALLVAAVIGRVFGNG